MLIDRKQEIKLHDYTNAIIGLFGSVECWIRWQAARMLIRWQALVIRGEDDQSPEALVLKKTLDDLLA